MFSIPSDFIVDPKIVGGILKYRAIMSAVYNVDVSTDATFRRTFCSYYGLTEHTTPEFQDVFFQYMERIKNIRPLPSFSQILLDLFTLTKRIDFSFASKMLHTLDPHKPLLDQQIMRLLGFNLLPYGKATKRIAYYSEVYETICYEYDTVARDFANGVTSKICEALRLFNFTYPCYASLTTVKKIDLILFRMKNERSNSLLNI